jgi:hypothetical protein
MNPSIVFKHEETTTVRRLRFLLSLKGNCLLGAAYRALERDQ